MDAQAVIERLTDTIHVSRSFGPAYETGDTLVIPVALVAGGGGGGGGTGSRTPEGPQESGSGGGFGTVSWPLGVYTITNGTARWVPALDATRVVLSALALARVVARLRHRRAGKAALPS